MRALVVEDDFTGRIVLQELLAPFFEVHVAVNGKEAWGAIQGAAARGAPYDLICLDIMMPEMDGQALLKEVRRDEDARGVPLGEGVKIIMTTALGDSDNVMQAYRGRCDAYLVKPIDRARLLQHLESFGFA